MLTTLMTLSRLMIPVCVVAIVGLTIGWLFRKGWGYRLFGAAMVCFSLLCGALYCAMQIGSGSAAVCAVVSLLSGIVYFFYPRLKRRYCARYDEYSLRQAGIDSVSRARK